MTEQEERITDSIRKAAAAMGVSEADLRAYTEGILEGAESRVQELEGERDALDAELQIRLPLLEDAEERAEAAESHLARREEALREIANRKSISVAWVRDKARAALTHPPPPSSTEER
jgi:hypothetical protein